MFKCKIPFKMYGIYHNIKYGPFSLSHGMSSTRSKRLGKGAFLLSPSLKTFLGKVLYRLGPGVDTPSPPLIVKKTLSRFFNPSLIVTFFTLIPALFSQNRGIIVFYETILCPSNFQFLFLSPQNLFHV